MTARSICPDLIPESEEFAAMFEQALKLFAHCHHIYDSCRVLKDREIDRLGTRVKHELKATFYITHSTISESYIKEFMSFHWTHFPAATVTPKMHMLEEHTVPFLRRWHIRFGFMGEQGAESIHNSISWKSII